MMLHMTSLNEILAAVLTLDWCFETIFDHVSIHLNEWQLLPTLEDTYFHPVHTALLSMMV